jgi:hypothetical protein
MPSEKFPTSHFPPPKNGVPGKSVREGRGRAEPPKQGGGKWEVGNPAPIQRRRAPACLPHRYLAPGVESSVRAPSASLRSWAPHKLRLHSECVSCRCNGIRLNAERVAELVPAPKLTNGWPVVQLLISLCSKCYAELVPTASRGRGCPKVQEPSDGERRRSVKKPQMPKSGDF